MTLLLLLLHASNTAYMVLHDDDDNDYDGMMIVILTTPVISSIASSIDYSVGGGVDAIPPALRAHGPLREGLRHTPLVRGW